MPTPRRDFGVAVDAGGRIFTEGGFSGSMTNVLEVFDPGTGVWTTKAPCQSPANDMGSCSTRRRDGSTSPAATTRASSPSFFEYDPTANAWTQKSSLPHQAIGVRLAAANGKIYAIGGSDFTNLASHVLEYDPATNQWTTKSAIPHPRADHGLVTLPNGKIYAIGGGTVTGTPTASVDEYDPVTDTWTTRADLPTARSGLATSITANGYILAIAGIDSSGFTTDAVDEYNPTTGAWTAKTAVPFAGCAMGL